MRKLVMAPLLVAFIASNAAALNTDQLLSAIAMPLAVDAVSRLTGVDQSRLASFVGALNQANVQPTQVVEVVRYVPVALVPQANQTTDIVQFTNDRITQGVTGDALVNAIVQQLSSNYNVTPQLTVNEPADSIPSDVLTRLGVSPSDPLAAIALPLAVAAVSNIAGVPQDQLASLVSTLNNANVPVTQEVQIVRYVPVALVDNGPQFVQFVQQQTSNGVTGPALVPVVTQQIRTYYPARVQVTEVPEPSYTPEPPPVVVNRVVEVQQHPMHPHGGPPGQLKKEYGYQTGAEVVHREKKHERRDEELRPMISAAPAPPPQPRMVVPVPQAQPGPVVVEPHGHGRGPEGNGPPGQMKKEEHGNGKGHGKD